MKRKLKGDSKSLTINLLKDQSLKRRIC